jgi:hypothetical protein
MFGLQVANFVDCVVASTMILLRKRDLLRLLEAGFHVATFVVPHCLRLDFCRPLRRIVFAVGSSCS